MEEREAIARLAGGDISGLELLVSLYQLRAVRAAYLICRDPALAEDIVQTAFIRVYERIDQFDTSRPFAPWFLRVVTNDALKAAQRGERTVSLQEDSGFAALLSEEDIEERLEAMETSAAISEAIAQLPPEQRAAIVLRYYLELSDAEMSTRLECATGTVRWRLHTARQRLKQLLPAWVRPGAADIYGIEPNVAPVNVYAPKGDTT
ncbi:MAG: RNA polymerase sigma factor [Chloroflexota bacterium]